MFFSKAQIATLLAFASIGFAVAVPSPEAVEAVGEPVFVEESELAARAPQWTVKVYKKGNCGTTPDFTYTGTGSKPSTKFNLGYEVKSVLPLPGPNCNMVLAPKDAFPYFVFEGNTQCWTYNHIWDSFSVTCP